MKKKLKNNYTTPAQSEQLLINGVPSNSADGYYSSTIGNNNRVWLIEGSQFDTFSDVYDWYKNNNSGKCCPCWSVGRLIEIYATCTDCSLFELPLEDSLIETLIDGIEWNMLDFSKLNELC